MNYKINFGSIGRTEYLENFIKQKIEKLKEHNPKKGMLHIWVDILNSLESKGGPLFVAKLRLIRPRKREIFITKKNSDILDSIHDVVDSTRKSLRRDKEKRLTGRMQSNFKERSSIDESEQQQLSREAI